MTKLVWIVGWLLCAGVARAERPPPVSPPIETTDQFSRDAAVIIGNEAYQALPQVVYATRDARAVTEWLQKTRGISRYRTKMLENATRSEIERAVQRTARRVKSRGTLWITTPATARTSARTLAAGCWGSRPARSAPQTARPPWRRSSTARGPPGAPGASC